MTTPDPFETILDPFSDETPGILDEFSDGGIRPSVLRALSEMPRVQEALCKAELARAWGASDEAIDRDLSRFLASLS